ncbi:CopG family transcriptional regulator [Streptomyces xiamenensis]|uniref:ribbon-helix-helix domain-containing protein n=1 Tax=Streptomyces xiamenensis TaxID=408015 RepID=UPI0035E0C103
MSMKRTYVYADPEDLAIIKEAARRRGVSEAEIIRQGIHLAAMANRVWDEPLFSRVYEGPGHTLAKEEARDAVSDASRTAAGARVGDRSERPGARRPSAGW